ncbi:MAG: DUF1974 domain-containing protein, partial [Planctomycetota bacterium]
AAFATLSDAAMLLLGGSLKRREKISGRFADALAWMYFGSALLKHYVGAGRPAGERPFFLWGSRQALFEIEKALQGILDNFPARPVAILLRRVLFPLGSRHRAPRDRVGAQVARALLNDGETRNALTRDIYTPAPDEQGLGTLERAFELSIEAAPIVKEIRKAVRAGRLEKSPRSTLAERARQQGVIDEEQWSALRAAEEAREDVIQVDSFESQPCGEVRV